MTNPKRPPHSRPMEPRRSRGPMEVDLEVRSSSAVHRRACTSRSWSVTPTRLAGWVMARCVGCDVVELRRSSGGVA